MGIKKNHTNEFKAKGAMAAMRKDRTLSELATAFGVHPITIGLWKKRVTRGLKLLGRLCVRYSPLPGCNDRTSPMGTLVYPERLMMTSAGE